MGRPCETFRRLALDATILGSQAEVWEREGRWEEARLLHRRAGEVQVLAHSLVPEGTEDAWREVLAVGAVVCLFRGGALEEAGRWARHYLRTEDALTPRGRRELRALLKDIDQAKKEVERGEPLP